MAQEPSPDLVLIGQRRAFGRDLGQRRAFGRDLYHRFLGRSFPMALAVIALCLLTINTLFALLYLYFGGVANAEDGSFLDAFSFSMQTLATIGYGAMYPQGVAAKIISDAEALVGLISTALSTGLLFTKFTLTRPTIRFTRRLVICPFNGVPTLMFRVGNDRGNLIIEAQARLTLTRTERTEEGALFYRTVDLPLSRDRSISFTRSWTLMHPITPASPLYGLDAAARAAQEIELHASVGGTDDTSLQPVYGRHRWEDRDIFDGHRLVDLLRPLPDGRVEADVRKFDEIEPIP